VIRLENIAWRAGSFRLEGINLAVPSGVYAVLMGRTGCGKTTLIEILCGLRQPTSGRVVIDDRDVTHEPPGARGIGYVPQDGALFPTMRVAQQIGFALRIRRRPAQEIQDRVASLAAELNLAHLLHRLPQDLSGGERQRVALGRALAAQPALLLLDEPLSAVDEEMRGDLITILKRAQREHRLTVLHVTHSSVEATELADSLFTLKDGCLQESPRLAG
jgi:ABC-type sugar transport system ATPase subunit